MKKIIYILILLISISCKTIQIESKLQKTNTITEYYENGKIKSVGNIDDFNKEFNNYRIGLWNEFYENGKLKSSGNYKLGTYEQCCTGGLCDGYYSYKIGEWIYFYENGKLKAKGTYRIGKKHKETSCEGGDEINFGFVTENWEFYDKNRKKISPTENDINEIEKSSFLDEWDMMKD
ncbi:toxin-antitoxin system YwqK family antitoxin [Lutibacter sp.]